MKKNESRKLKKIRRVDNGKYSDKEKQRCISS